MRKYIAAFAVAFLIRVAAVLVTTLTGLNPEADADAATFANIAERAAGALIRGDLIAENMRAIEPLWGTILAPYWLLPGPSVLYGRLGNALLGALAVYNVYVIARRYHSHRAGVVAALPMIVYPSFVAVHSTLLREALVLFCITLAARLVLVPGIVDARWKRYLLVVPVLALASILRPENSWIFIVVAIVGGGVYLLTVTRFSIPLSYAVLGLLIPVTLWKWSDLVQELLSFAETRRLRAVGRTKYLATTLPDSLLEIVAFSWIGALYFLFSPFPWMIETSADLLVGLEGMVNLLFAIAAIYGVRRLVADFPAATAALVAALVLGSVLYGLGEANVGTAMRHRQQLVWILYVFGGIAVAGRFEFVLGVGASDDRPAGPERSTPTAGARDEPPA